MGYKGMHGAGLMINSIAVSDARIKKDYWFRIFSGTGISSENAQVPGQRKSDTKLMYVGVKHVHRGSIAVCR